MIEVTNGASRQWCTSLALFSCPKAKQKEPQMLFFFSPPVKFTFSFSKRLPQCLIWTFRSTDRFIYSAGGEGPFQSCASPDKAPADCHSNSMLNTSPPKLVGLRQRSHSVDFPTALCKKSHSVAFTLLKNTSIQQTKGLQSRRRAGNGGSEVVRFREEDSHSV